MSLPDASELDAALEATWPPLRRWRVGPWTLRDGAGGGQRVSAATLDGPLDEAEIETAENEMAACGQPALFRVREGDAGLDAALAARGYRVVDPTIFYAAPCSVLLNPAQRPLDAVTCETPLGIHAEIWRAGGIGAPRLDVMARVAGPRAWLLARLHDHAAGAGFVALHGAIAMVHALETVQARRRSGAARAMMHRAASWAMAQGAATMALAVTEANQGANALYSGLGMTPVARYHYRKKPEGPTT